MLKNLTIIALLISFTVHAQWTQTNGIAGGYFTSLISSGQNLIAATGNGHLFRYNGTDWSPLPGNLRATSFNMSGNAIVGLEYEDMIVSTDNGITWTLRTIPENLSYQAVVEDEGIYTLTTSADSVFRTVNLGESWQHFPVAPAYTENGQPRTILMFMDIYKRGNTFFAHVMTDDPVNMLLLLESPDSGMSWQVSFRPPAGDLINRIITDGTTSLVSTSRSVYRRTGLNSWVEANGGLPSSSGNGIVTKLRIVDGSIYAFYSDDDSSLFRFNNTANLWEVISTPSYAMDATVYQGEVTIATTGMITKRSNGSWTNLTEGLIATTSLPMALNESTVFTQHGGTTYRTVNSGSTWDPVVSQTGRFQFNGEDVLTVSAQGLMKSTDLGSTWMMMNSGIPASYIPKASDVAASGSTLYAGFNGTRRRDHLPAVWEQGGIYRSTDNGASWSALNSGLVHEGGVPAPVLNIHSSAERVLIRTIEGTYVLNGNSWMQINSSLPANTYFNNVMMIADSIILGSNHGLMVSVNNGATWRVLQNGLPSTGFNLYYFHYFRYMEQFYAFDYLEGGLYRLADTTWLVAEFSVPGEMSVAGFSSAGNTLYTGMIDRGIWKYTEAQTTIGESVQLPGVFRLEQNHPNPFNPVTVIRYVLPVAGTVELSVYNTLGEKVASVVNSEMAAGEHRVTFEAGDLNSGVYFYTLTYGGSSQTGKMILMK